MIATINEKIEAKSWKQYVDAFLWAKQAQRLVSKNTLIAYQNDLNQFLEYVTEYAVELDNQFLQKFFVYLEKCDFARSTRARKMSALLQFLKFCVGDKLIPLIALEAPKLKKLEEYVPFLEPDDLEKIRKVLDAKNDHRLKAMIEVLYSTGMRISELLSLKRADIQKIEKENKLLIQGKGEKQRFVFFNQVAVKSLKYYLENIHLNLNYSKNEFMFSAGLNKKTSIKGASLTRQRVFQLLKELAIEAQVPVDKMFPHSFRHRMLSDLVLGGADLVSVQKIAGHEQLNTTARYTHIEDNLYQDILAFHPIAQKIDKDS